MANRYSVASGLASLVTTWDGGLSVPVEGDRVLIQAAHTVTLDGTYIWGDDSTSSITINGVSTSNSITIAGTLSHSRTVTTSLTCKGNLYVPLSGYYDAGSFASVMPLAFPATTVLNYSAALADGKYGFWCDNGGKLTAYGITRKRVATLTADAAITATSIIVSDATGWQVGDEIYLSSTQTSANKHEVVTISAGYVSGNLTVPVSALVYAHITKCPCGNMTNNVTFKNYNNTYMAIQRITTGANSVTNSHELGYVTFDNADDNYPRGGITFDEVANYTATLYPNPFKYLESVSFISRANFVLYEASPTTITPRVFTNCSMVSTITGDTTAAYIRGNSQFNYCLMGGGIPVQADSNVGAILNDCWIASSQTGIRGAGRGFRYNRAKFSGAATGWALNFQTAPGSVDTIIEGSDVSETFTTRSGAQLVEVQSCGTNISATLSNTYVGTTPVLTNTGQRNLTSTSYVKLVNRNRDVTLQEEWYQAGIITRENTIKKRSTSSARMQVSTADTPFTRSFTINISNNETVRIIGYCQYDTAYYNAGVGFVAPTMTLSGTINGVALTPVVYTAASANAGVWDLIDKSITNSTGADGQITVTFSVQSTNTAGLTYFDGINLDPLVVRARHYGFLFSESNPKRYTNPAISANEATAAAYTGMTVTWGTSLSTTAITASNTLQKLYDYTQAQACLNIPSALPMSASGLAGNPAITALGNITVSTTQVLNGAGSVNIGSYILSTEFAGGSTYTYTGGTWAQLTTVPTFSTGTLSIGAAATYTFTMTSATLSMTPTAPSTYNLSNSTFSGTIDLRNTTANAITVQVPSGTTTTTVNNTGGVITVQAPQIYQSVTVNGLVANSRIQIYDTTHAVELYNGVVGGTTYTWTDTVAAASNRAIRVRIAYQSGVLAKNFIDANIGTCGTTSPSNAVTYLAAQTDDYTYNLYAINGSTVTGITVTISGGNRVNFNLGTSFTNPTIYAYQVYWQYTATGIAQETAFISSPDGGKFTYIDFKWKNTTANTITITGGYPVDSVTGLSATLIDTTGGNICVAPDHVAVVTTGSGPLTTSQANQLAAAATNTDLSRVVDGYITKGASEKIILAALAGKRAGIGSVTEKYMAQDGATPRITLVPDSNGNGTPTLNGA